MFFDKGIYLGSSYYPERWSSDRYESDAKLMKEAGFSFIRTGEFAWSKFEAAEGRFDFAWMDEAIKVFEKYGIKVIMCTPTAAPMPWITAKHPDILPVTEEGKVFSPGQRRQYCFNNLNYRYYSEIIVRKMAEHYCENPSIAAWQIDNELGGEEFICCCDTCKKAFQAWLQKKYKTLDELNKRWGAAFFSFDFTDWCEIPVPVGHNVKFFNPSFRKDYYQFYSDSLKDYLYFQVKILKEYVKDVPITTNRFTLFWVDKFDNWMDEKLDVAAFDNYDSKLSLAAFHHDFYRSVKKEKKHWVLEQSTGTRYFGQNQNDIVLQSIQSFAKGSQLICYFSWRQINYACEQDFYGILDQEGRPGEVYELLKALGDWTKKEGEYIAALKIKNDIAIIYSFESLIMYYSNHAFSHVKYFKEIYDNFYSSVFELGQAADFISNFDEIFIYKIVIIPLHILAVENCTDKLRAFAQNGGTVIITGDFMHKSADNFKVIGQSIKKLDELLGIEHKKLVTIQGDTYAGIDPQKSHAVIKSDISESEYGIHGFFNRFSIVDNNVTVLAEVISPEIEAKAPAAVEKYYGRGKILFIAALTEKDFIKELIKKCAENTGVELSELPEDVEVNRLYNNEDKLAAYFIINKNFNSVSIKFKEIHEAVEVLPQDYKLIKLGND